MNLDECRRTLIEAYQQDVQSIVRQMLEARKRDELVDRDDARDLLYALLFNHPRLVDDQTAVEILMCSSNRRVIDEVESDPDEGLVFWDMGFVVMEADVLAVLLDGGWKL